MPPTPARAARSASRTGASTRSATASASRCRRRDRKSTRLNSSHSQISYAVFCLKKKKKCHRSLLPHQKIDIQRVRLVRIYGHLHTDGLFMPHPHLGPTALALNGRIFGGALTSEP